MDDPDLLLLADDAEVASFTAEPTDGWQILIVDDEADVHVATRFVLRDVKFRNRPLTLLSAFSGKEAVLAVGKNPGIALLLLDVVMETATAGLDVVRQIREDLGDTTVQIILRTGQPGHAPESKVIVDYEINDYESKSELTSQRLVTSVLAALRSYEHLTAINQQKKALALFGRAANRFVPKEFLRVLNKTSIVEAMLGDQVRQEMTIVFMDVRSFSSFSERVTLQETFAFINELLDWVCPVIRAYGGFVDKYLGDGLLALFPGRVDDALEMIVEIRIRIEKNNAARVQRGEPPVFLGIGAHYGSLMLGIIGEAERLEATVIGDAVNIACHIESLTKRHGLDVLVSEALVKQAGDGAQYRFDFVEQAQLKGRTQEIGVYAFPAAK
jgi:two-component system sensor histidine kinase ChiS